MPEKKWKKKVVQSLGEMRKGELCIDIFYYTDERTGY